MKKNLLNWLGLLGVISLISYTLAVFLSPLAYPGYDGFSQAVSDLSASNAPSRILWDQLSSFYGPCGLIALTAVCIFIQGKLTKILRIGMYLFTIMNFISAVGYSMFPLSDISHVNSFQDIMHNFIVTPLVVGLSIASLVLLIIGGFKQKKYKSLAIFASVSLGFMLLGPIGMALVPKEYFGIFERFSVFSASAFVAVLGIYLFLGFPASKIKSLGV